MSATATPSLARASGPGRASARAVPRGAARLLDWLVAFWVFTGALVLFEPSPYEVSFLLLLPVAMIGGFGLHRSTTGLLWLLVLFIPFALIGAFQTRITPTTDALVFALVTVFLIFTAYFVANYVAQSPHGRMRLIIGAYTVCAVISAFVGAFAYFGILPGADLFLRFGRAKAFFQDPNVYGPFLILPAMFALQRVLLRSGWRATWSFMVFMVLLVGVFVSFSRAAWGHFAISALIVAALCFFLEATARQRIRMILLSVVGALLIVAAIGGLLSIPSVERLFEERTESQNYDSGATGRFGRQGYAFGLALDHPWGIGPLEFRHLRITEEPHDTYVSVLHVYGWGGGFIYYAFILLTLWRGVSGLTRASPHRVLLIPLMATFVPLVGEAAIIDTDHWRHFFLVAGLIWGVTAALARIPTPARALAPVQARAA